MLEVQGKDELFLCIRVYSSILWAGLTLHPLLVMGNACWLPALPASRYACTCDISDNNPRLVHASWVGYIGIYTSPTHFGPWLQPPLDALDPVTATCKTARSRKAIQQFSITGSVCLKELAGHMV
jgi:hypothetical protein